MSRGVDKITDLPDAAIAVLDKEYLERHPFDKMFSEALSNLIKQQPPLPVQYLIDFVSFGPEKAVQDPVTGLSAHRKAKLMDVFRVIDKADTGKISFRALQRFTSVNGGELLTDEDLASIFSDFHPTNDSMVTQGEFMIFWSKVFRSLGNARCDAMIQELLV